MNEQNYGDEKFKEFMENGNSLERDPLILIIKAIQYKITAISKIYADSLKVYVDMSNEDPLKKELRKHILSLMEHTQLSIDQFNYALIDEEDDEEEEDINGTIN